MKNNFSKILVAVVVVFCGATALSGCKKETTPPVTTVTTSTNTVITSPYFMQGDFGGQVVTLQGTPQPFTTSFSNATIEHEGHDGEHHDGDDEDVPLVTGTRWFDNSSTDLLTSTQGSIEFRKVVIRVFIAPMPVQQQHYDMLALGTSVFADGQQLSNGAYVTLRDNQGVLWTTKGDQTGSTITITSRGEFTGTSTTIAGRFTAKMYDGNGNVKQLSNVNFSGIAGL